MKKLNCILLIDDDESTNRFHEIIIKQINLTDTVVKAKNGKGALDVLTNPKNSIEPDLIFLDLNMPVMDGFRFIELYTGTKNFKEKRPKIVVLSTSLIDEEKEKIESNDEIDMFLNKPLTKKRIANLMTNFWQ
ncbi:response regulator [Polaribacter sp. P097]|uniref:response regulator n=1 Tax=Polaribacter sp. P097 TaxID=3117398 RepID=UPI002FDFBBCE